MKLKLFVVLLFLSGGELWSRDRDEALARLEAKLAEKNHYGNFEFSIDLGERYSTSYRNLSQRIYQLERYSRALEFGLWDAEARIADAEERITQLERNRERRFLCTMTTRGGASYTGRGETPESAQENAYERCRDGFQSHRTCTNNVGFRCNTQ